MNPKRPRPADPVHDVLRREPTPLGPFFAPRSVAVIGATESAGSVGRTLLWNLIKNPFGGLVFPVNPKRKSVLGIKAYPGILDLPDPVDLAVVVTPAPAVPGIIGECAQAGVPAAIVISAGFKELGPPGAELERQIQERAGRMRIIGPNCLGVMCPASGLNATFAAGMALPGNVAFISQSGALCTAILDWSLRERVGFSTFASVGSMLDVGWGDLIDHLGSDPQTQSILIYMETIGDARAFLSAAREVALTKPIIVIKAGRTEAAARAASSHTGALAGSDEVLAAAFRRCGVLRVSRIDELFHMAQVLARQPRPRGPRLTILTNAGGPAVLATDALVAAAGMLAPLSPETMTALNDLLPPHWSRNNPIDILGDAGPDRYRKALEIVAKEPQSDGILVVLTPQDMTDPTQTAEQIRSLARIPGVPILASWMGGSAVTAGNDILNRAGIPTFEFPDAAARAFAYMWRYSYNLRGLYETPSLGGDLCTRAGAEAAKSILGRAREAGRTLLTEAESKDLLRAYGLPTVETQVASSVEDAVRRAADIGYPVVLKLHSEVLIHKSDVGGVKLHLADAESVHRAFVEIQDAALAQAGTAAFSGVTVQPMVQEKGHELILGSHTDPQFGPVLLFGAGGILVEVFRDCALALPPLNATLARRMMEQTRIFTALQGVRGQKPVDFAALEQILVRFSQLVVEQRMIKEIDINPLWVSSGRIVALDARVILHEAGMTEDRLPRLAIRPYPEHYVGSWTLRDGTPVTIRPIRPEDEPMVVHLHEGLSERSVRLRYFQALKLDQRTAHERLIRVCFVDYDREMALVAEHADATTGDRQILGMARLSRQRFCREAEFSLLISDKWQHHGLGTELLRRLLHIGEAEQISRITADILSDNLDMQRVCQRLGFKLSYSLEDPIVKAEITLPVAAASSRT